MEANPEIEASEEEWASPQGWRALDDTIVLVGLLIFQASLFKSGYTSEVMVELHERIRKLVKYYGGKGV